MAEKKKEFLKLRHISVDSKVFKTFLLDLLFYLSLIASFFIFTFILKNVLSGIQNIDFANILTENIEIANSNLLILKVVFAKMLLTILLLLVLILASFTLFKGLIWAKLLKKKFSLKYFWKTLLMNFLFFSFFILLFSYSILESKKILAFILVLIFLHFTYLSYYFVTRREKHEVFNSIINSAKFTLKVNKYILPYLVIIVLFTGMTFITQAILSKVLPLSYYMLIIAILIIFYISILRNYFVRVLVDLE